MKKKLKSLFEYQTFENNKELNNLLEEVEDRYSEYALNESELEMATGGLPDRKCRILVGSTVSYNIENMTKTGVIEQIDKDKILINGEWIPTNKINS